MTPKYMWGGLKSSVSTNISLHLLIRLRYDIITTENNWKSYALIEWFYFSDLE